MGKYSMEYKLRSIFRHGILIYKHFNFNTTQYDCDPDFAKFSSSSTNISIALINNLPKFSVGKI